jgi:hypothetical protein
MDKKFRNRLILESSYPGTLSLLLETEDVDQAFEASASGLQAIQVRLGKIKSLIQKLPSGNYRNGLEDIIIDALGGDFQTLFDKSQDSDENADLATRAKEAGVIADQVDEMSRNISAVLQINLQLMETLSGIVVDAGLEKGENKDIPLIEILKETGLEDDVKKELQKSFKSAVDSVRKPPKGFFAKIADKIFGNFFNPIKEIEQNMDGLIDGILQMTPIEIGKFAIAIINYGKDDQKEAEKVTAATEEAEAAIQDEAGDDPSAEETIADSEEATEREDFDLLAFVKDKYPDLAKSLEAMAAQNPESVKDQLEDLDQQVEDGDISPDDVIEDLEGVTDAGLTINKDDLLNRVEKDVRLGYMGKVIVQKMIDSGLFDDFGIKVERAVLNKNLNLLLEEALPSEELSAVLDLVKEEEPEAFEDADIKDVVTGLNDLFSEENIDIQLELPEIEEEEIVDEDGDGTPDAEQDFDDDGIPNAEDEDDDGDGIPDEKDNEDNAEEATEADVELSDKELESAVRGAEAEDLPTGVAVNNALDAWASNLSKTSQDTLNQAGRFDSLKDSINTTLDGAADAVAKEVESAIEKWRNDNENALLNSKRFAAKNFDSLQTMIPQLVSAIMKKTEESRFTLTKTKIRKAVYKHLDKRFKNHEILIESSRWQRLAGIK